MTDTTKPKDNAPVVIEPTQFRDGVDITSDAGVTKASAQIFLLARNPTDGHVETFDPADGVYAYRAGGGYETGSFLGAYQDFIQQARRLARDDGKITLFDAATVMGDQASGANTLIDTDHVHPTAAGHTALAAAMDALLASA